MTLPITQSLQDLAEILGPLPPGDTPAAWWYSTHPDVLDGYALWLSDYNAWTERITKLYSVSGFRQLTRAYNNWPLAQRLRVSRLGGTWLMGLSPTPKMGEPPRFWRLNNQGLLVPRRYTRMEKNSQVNKLFTACRRIPSAIEYLPGIPGALFIPPTTPGHPTSAYPVHARKPASAVLAFVGMPPEGAYPVFEPEPEYWQRLKLSTWHLLRERQRAGEQTPDQGLEGI